MDYFPLFWREICTRNTTETALDANVEEWMLLCKQAAQEQNPAKLLSLVERINELLERKDRPVQGVDASSAED